MDMKTENGAEIQNTACKRSGIMMRLRILKYANNEEYNQDDKDNIPHCTKFLKKLVMPWANMDSIICIDSYFASLPAAEELWKSGL